MRRKCRIGRLCVPVLARSASGTAGHWISAHTGDTAVFGYPVSAFVRLDVQKLRYAPCCALALEQHKAQPTSGSCRCAGRTAYGALVPMVPRVLMYSFVPGRSFSKKCCHTNGVDNGRQVSPSSPRASHRSDCTGLVSVCLPSRLP